MARRLRSRWNDLRNGLGFLPGVLLVFFAVLGIVVVEIDRTLGLDGARYVFAGDGSAARTVLSVVAGSLITVAGLTFSITMVALQLSSSQFSPRVLRTFFADRITQLTIGVFVGTFVYSLLVLRSVGTFGDDGFVPRLSVTIATLLGIGAVVLLVVFLQHVALMIQVSHIMGAIADDTLKRVEAIYPERYGRPADENPEDVQGEGEPGCIMAAGPGYVQRVELETLVEAVAGKARYVKVLVAPGDFANLDEPIAELWPAEAAQACEAAVRHAVPVRRERDLDQDVDFGLRQLTDTALKALSPGINDPATAVTCIRYIRTVMVRLTARTLATPVRAFPDAGVHVAVRRRTYDEYLDVLLQINRYAGADAWVVLELLGALEACGAAAARASADRRATAVVDAAEAVARRAKPDADDRDWRLIERAHAAVRTAARASS